MFIINNQSLMYTIFRVFIIAVITLSLVSCSEEKAEQTNIKEEYKDTTNIKKSQENKESIKEETDSKNLQNKKDEYSSSDNSSNNDSSYNGDNKWDKIVDPKEGADTALDTNSSSNDNQNPPTNSENNTDANFSLSSHYTSTFSINKDDVVLGNKDARVVLIEYYSPTCPHCAQYHVSIFPKLKNKYIDTNKIAYVIREFIGNKQDLDAAVLQRCGSNPVNINNFLKFQDIILAQQDKWASSNKYREILTNIGHIGGISPEAYAKCLEDDQITRVLIANTNLANKSPNFFGTPIFFLNGTAVMGGHSFANLSQLLDKALNEEASGRDSAP